jgi:hypothetical protein
MNNSGATSGKNGIMENSSGITGLTLIVYIIVIIMAFLLVAIGFERYFAPSVGNRNLVRIIIFGFMFNFAILFFLVMSFNKIKFEPGPPGPQGIRGRNGRDGTSGAMDGCKPIPKKLIKLRNEQRRQNQALAFEKPILATN